MLRTALEKTGHENGGLETTMFTSLSRKSGHFVSLMYDLYSETFIIKASVDHNVSFQEVTTIRDQITTDLSTLSGRLVGEWLIVNCADPKLNNQRVHVYLVERNSRLQGTSHRSDCCLGISYQQSSVPRCRYFFSFSLSFILQVRMLIIDITLSTR